MLFRLNPTLLPIIIVLILVSAVISALPSIFQQNVVAVLEQAWANGWNWETTRSHHHHRQQPTRSCLYATGAGSVPYQNV